MRTAQDRITELTTRQRYDGSSMVIKLHAIKGYFDYEIYLIKEVDVKIKLPVGKGGLTLQKKNEGEIYESSIDQNVVIMKGKYNGEDPEELFRQAESLVGKWICGKQITKPNDINSPRSTS